MAYGDGNRGKGKVVKWLREHVAHEGRNCLKYPFSISPQLGYGQFSVDGKFQYAHRFMCELKNGPPPSDEHEAAHTCGNAHMGCINPNHLEWKTHQENAQDRVRHGNYSLRKGQPRFLLNVEKAEQIRALKGQKTQFEIAEMFGVSRCTVSSIHCGRGWTGAAKSRKAFTREGVEAIRKRYPETRVKELAAEYGVSPNVMWKLCNGQSYQFQQETHK